MGSQRYTRILNGAYVKLCVIELCLQIGMQMAQPVVSNAALALGATVTLAGIMAGLSSGVALSLRIVSGRLLSQIAPKKMLIASSAALAASSLVFALFNNLTALTVSCVLFGAGLVVKTVIGIAVCVRVVPKDSIGRAVAWLGMGNVFAVAVGPNLAQFVGLSMGYSITFLASGILLTIGTILCFTFPNVPLVNEESGSDGKTAGEESGKDEKTFGEESADDGKMAGKEPGESADAAAPTTPRPPAKGFARLLNYIYVDSLPLALMGFMEGVIFGIVNMLTLTVSQLRGMPETSLFFVVYVAVSFCMRPVVGKLYDRFGFARICPIMCAIMGTAMLTFAFTDSFAMVVVDGVLFALGQGCLWPCLEAESVHDVPLEKGSLSTNTLLFGVDLGVMVGPMVGGTILEAGGPMWMYLFAACVGALMTLWALQYTRIMKRRAARRAWR